MLGMPPMSSMSHVPNMIVVSSHQVIWHNAVMAQHFKELATSQGYERKRSSDNTFLQEWASTKSERVLNFMYKILINFLLKGVIL